MVILDTNPMPSSRVLNSSVDATFDVQKLYLQKELNNKKKRSRPRAVRFSTEPPTIIWTFVYSDLEKQKCFYERKDRRIFEDDRIRVCSLFNKKMRDGEPWEETDDLTLHGLEDFFRQCSKEETRKRHVAKVLNEQGRQRRTGEWHDETTLRYVSSESSGDARTRAIKIGHCLSGPTRGL